MTNRNSVRGIIDIFQISDRTIISGVGCKHAVWSRSLPSLRSTCGVRSCKSCPSKRWLAMSFPTKSFHVIHKTSWATLFHKNQRNFTTDLTDVAMELNVYMAALGTLSLMICVFKINTFLWICCFCYSRKQYIWTFSSSQCCVCEIVRSTDWKCQHLERKYLLALQQNEQIEYHSR